MAMDYSTSDQRGFVSICLEGHRSAINSICIPSLILKESLCSEKFCGLFCNLLHLL